MYKTFTYKYLEAYNFLFNFNTNYLYSYFYSCRIAFCIENFK